jgi:hypothetical protein
MITYLALTLFMRPIIYININFLKISHRLLDGSSEQNVTKVTSMLLISSIHEPYP